MEDFCFNVFLAAAAAFLFLLWGVVRAARKAAKLLDNETVKDVASSWFWFGG